jgi:peptidoglycan/xylan/chitin deacetylase (PgdA/CDA1 family)
MSGGRKFVLAVTLIWFGAVFFVAISAWRKEAGAFAWFLGVEGPMSRSTLPPRRLAQIADYDRGGPHRLAILVTDPQANWLGLALAFKAEGIPFTITQDYREALTHKVVFVYPSITGTGLPPEALSGLADLIHRGGGVLTFDLEGGGLYSEFGVRDPVPSRSRGELHWLNSTGPPEEQTTEFAKPGGELDLGSLAYPVTDAKVIATFEDGGAAITCRKAAGTACLMGFDLGALATRAIDGRADDVSRAYDNRYEPSLDVVTQWVKDFYVENEPMPFLVDTVPEGKQVSIVFTHDIDFTRSVFNAKGYADLERANGVKSTFFMQTKYISDWNDKAFLTPRTAPLVRALQDDEGMEVGSHTVAHSRLFSKFPLGTGLERYPDYHPFVEDKTKERGGSIFGETRVSKFLLERLSGVHVQSFRPGHLSYPYELPEVLASEGYAYSSSITADTCLTHLPHQLTYTREGDAPLPVYEFPVTIEDEEKPKLGDRFDMENVVTAKIAAHHGLVVILIHPDILGHKLEFERRMIAAWKDRAWMPDLAEYGSWWRARDRAEIDLDNDGHGWSLAVDAPEALNDTVVVLPKAGAAAAASGAAYRLANGHVRLDGVKGKSNFPLGALK